MAQIFADGFESGDTSAWDATSGTPTASNASALIGSWGCEIDADSEYVRDNFTAVERFRVRIYVDPNSVSMSTGAVFTLLAAMETNTPCGRIRLRCDGANYDIAAGIYDDSNSWQETAYDDISDAPTCIEADFHFVDSTGFVHLWIDNVDKETVSNIDCGTRNPDNARFGRLGSGGWWVKRIIGL